ncbi:MAG: lysylphosphatidylglycerol synthase transmembrane domain-containing protein [Acidimicrobiales bacterium]
MALSVCGAAVGFLVARAGDFVAAARLVSRVDPGWVGLAVLFEAASMVVFARMQRWLLRAGGVRLPLRVMVEITLAGNALATTLPGGVAWAAVWAFGQLKRRGVDRFLRVWVFFVAGGLSSFALFLVVVLGIEVAGSRGPMADLRWAALVLALLPLTFLSAWLLRRHLPRRRGRNHQSPAERGIESRSPVSRWAAAPAVRIRQLRARIDAVRLRPMGWAEVLGLALLNWLDDCFVVVASIEALHVPVPWRGIFVIYGISQIAAALPITPGGFGVVEGSLAALLTAYGMRTEDALAVVILYRLVSFWGLVPVGWIVFAALDFWPRRAGVEGHRRVLSPWDRSQEPPPAFETEPGLTDVRHST